MVPGEIEVVVMDNFDNMQTRIMKINCHALNRRKYDCFSKKRIKLNPFSQKSAFNSKKTKLEKCSRSRKYDQDGNSEINSNLNKMSKKRFKNGRNFKRINYKNDKKLYCLKNWKVKIPKLDPDIQILNEPTSFDRQKRDRTYVNYSDYFSEDDDEVSLNPNSKYTLEDGGPIEPLLRLNSMTPEIMLEKESIWKNQVEVSARHVPLRKLSIVIERLDPKIIQQYSRNPEKNYKILDSNGHQSFLIKDEIVERQDFHTVSKEVGSLGENSLNNCMNMVTKHFSSHDSESSTSLKDFKFDLEETNSENKSTEKFNLGYHYVKNTKSEHYQPELDTQTVSIFNRVLAAKSKHPSRQNSDSFDLDILAQATQGIFDDRSITSEPSTCSENVSCVEINCANETDCTNQNIKEDNAKFVCELYKEHIKDCKVILEKLDNIPQYKKFILLYKKKSKIGNSAANTLQFDRNSFGNNAYSSSLKLSFSNILEDIADQNSKGSESFATTRSETSNSNSIPGSDTEFILSNSSDSNDSWKYLNGKLEECEASSNTKRTKPAFSPTSTKKRSVLPRKFPDFLMNYEDESLESLSSSYKNESSKSEEFVPYSLAKERNASCSLNPAISAAHFNSSTNQIKTKKSKSKRNRFKSGLIKQKKIVIQSETQTSFTHVNDKVKFETLDDIPKFNGFTTNYYRSNSHDDFFAGFEKPVPSKSILGNSTFHANGIPDEEPNDNSVNSENVISNHSSVRKNVLSVESTENYLKEILENLGETSNTVRENSLPSVSILKYSHLSSEKWDESFEQESNCQEHNLNFLEAKLSSRIKLPNDSLNKANTSTPLKLVRDEYRFNSISPKDNSAEFLKDQKSEVKCYFSPELVSSASSFSSSKYFEPSRTASIFPTSKYSETSENHNTEIFENATAEIFENHIQTFENKDAVSKNYYAESFQSKDKKPSEINSKNCNTELRDISVELMQSQDENDRLSIDDDIVSSNIIDTNENSSPLHSSYLEFLELLNESSERCSEKMESVQQENGFHINETSANSSDSDDIEILEPQDPLALDSEISLEVDSKNKDPLALDSEISLEIDSANKKKLTIPAKNGNNFVSAVNNCSEDFCTSFVKFDYTTNIANGAKGSSFSTERCAMSEPCLHSSNENNHIVCDKGEYDLSNAKTVKKLHENVLENLKESYANDKKFSKNCNESYDENYIPLDTLNSPYFNIFEPVSPYDELPDANDYEVAKIFEEHENSQSANLEPSLSELPDANDYEVAKIFEEHENSQSANLEPSLSELPDANDYEVAKLFKEHENSQSANLEPSLSEMELIDFCEYPHFNTHIDIGGRDNVVCDQVSDKDAIDLSVKKSECRTVMDIETSFKKKENSGTISNEIGKTRKFHDFTENYEYHYVPLYNSDGELVHYISYADYLEAIKEQNLIEMKQNPNQNAPLDLTYQKVVEEPSVDFECDGAIFLSYDGIFMKEALTRPTSGRKKYHIFDEWKNMYERGNIKKKEGQKSQKSELNKLEVEKISLEEVNISRRGVREESSRLERENEKIFDASYIRKNSSFEPNHESFFDSNVENTQQDNRDDQNVKNVDFYEDLEDDPENTKETDWSVYGWYENFSKDDVRNHFFNSASKTDLETVKLILEEAGVNLDDWCPLPYEVQLDGFCDKNSEDESYREMRSKHGQKTKKTNKLRTVESSKIDYYKCAICDIIYIREKTMRNHIAAKHKKKPHKNYKLNMDSSDKLLKKFYSLKAKGYYKSDKAFLDSLAIKMQQLKSVLCKYYTCSICDIFFTKIESIRYHLYRKHKIFKANTSKNYKVNIAQKNILLKKLVKNKKEEKFKVLKSNIDMYVPETSNYLYVNSKQNYLLTYNQRAVCKSLAGILRTNDFDKNIVKVGAINTVSDNSIFKCALCSYFSDIQASTLQHITKVHEKKIFFVRCLLCCFVGKNTKIIFSHLRNAHKKFETQSFSYSVHFNDTRFLCLEAKVSIKELDIKSISDRTSHSVVNNFKRNVHKNSTYGKPKLRNLPEPLAEKKVKKSDLLQSDITLKDLIKKGYNTKIFKELKFSKEDFINLKCTKRDLKLLNFTLKDFFFYGFEKNDYNLLRFTYEDFGYFYFSESDLRSLKFSHKDLDDMGYDTDEIREIEGKSKKRNYENKDNLKNNLPSLAVKIISATANKDSNFTKKKNSKIQQDVTKVSKLVRITCKECKRVMIRSFFKNHRHLCHRNDTKQISNRVLKNYLYFCKKCSMCVLKKGDLLRHISSEHSESVHTNDCVSKVSYCSACNEKIESADDFKLHFRNRHSHLIEKLSREALEVGSLKSDIPSISRDINQDGDVKGAVNKSSIDQNLKESQDTIDYPILRRISCEECKLILPEVFMDSHKSLCHRNDTKLLALNSIKQDLYYCKKCPKFYVSKNSVLRHIENKHSNSVCTGKDDCLLKFTYCSACGQVVDSFINLESHFRSNHSNLLGKLKKNAFNISLSRYSKYRYTEFQGVLDNLLTLKDLDTNCETINCSQCELMIPMLSFYKNHQQIFHKKGRLPEKLLQKFVYYCESCSYKTASGQICQKNVVLHVQKYHQNSDRKGDGFLKVMYCCTCFERMGSTDLHAHYLEKHPTVAIKLSNVAASHVRTDASELNKRRSLNNELTEAQAVQNEKANRDLEKSYNINERSFRNSDQVFQPNEVIGSCQKEPEEFIVENSKKRPTILQNLLDEASLQKFTCDCGFKSPTATYLSRHKIICHGSKSSDLRISILKNTLYYCKKCEYKTVNVLLGKSHVRSRHDYTVESSNALVKVIYCAACSEKVEDRDFLSLHYQENHPTLFRKIFQKDKFDSSQDESMKNLPENESKSLHVNQESEICDDEAQSEQKYFLQNLMDDTTFSKLSCNRCNFMAHNFNFLSKHQRISHESPATQFVLQYLINKIFYCIKCSYRNIHEMLTNAHIRGHNLTASFNKLVREVLYCAVCSEKLDSLRHVGAHYKNSHSELISKISTNALNKFTVFCNTCEKYFEVNHFKSHSVSHNEKVEDSSAFRKESWTVNVIVSKAKKLVHEKLSTKVSRIKSAYSEAGFDKNKNCEVLNKTDKAKSSSNEITLPDGSCNLTSNLRLIRIFDEIEKCNKNEELQEEKEELQNYASKNCFISISDEKYTEKSKNLSGDSESSFNPKKKDEIINSYGLTHTKKRKWKNIECNKKSSFVVKSELQNKSLDAFTDILNEKLRCKHNPLCNDKKCVTYNSSDNFGNGSLNNIGKCLENVKPNIENNLWENSKFNLQSDLKKYSENQSVENVSELIQAKVAHESLNNDSKYSPSDLNPIICDMLKDGDKCQENVKNRLECELLDNTRKFITTNLKESLNKPECEIEYSESILLKNTDKSTCVSLLSLEEEPINNGSEGQFYLDKFIASSDLLPSQSLRSPTLKKLCKRPFQLSDDKMPDLVMSNFKNSGLKTEVMKSPTYSKNDIRPIRLLINSLDDEVDKNITNMHENIKGFEKKIVRKCEILPCKENCSFSDNKAELVLKNGSVQCFETLSPHYSELPEFEKAISSKNSNIDSYDKNFISESKIKSSETSPKRNDKNKNSEEILKSSTSPKRNSKSIDGPLRNANAKKVLATDYNMAESRKHLKNETVLRSEFEERPHKENFIIANELKCKNKISSKNASASKIFVLKNSKSSKFRERLCKEENFLENSRFEHNISSKKVLKLNVTAESKNTIQKSEAEYSKMPSNETSILEKYQEILLKDSISNKEDYNEVNHHITKHEGTAEVLQEFKESLRCREKCNISKTLKIKDEASSVNENKHNITSMSNTSSEVLLKNTNANKVDEELKNTNANKVDEELKNTNANKVDEELKNTNANKVDEELKNTNANKVKDNEVVHWGKKYESTFGVMQILKKSLCKEKCVSKINFEDEVISMNKNKEPSSSEKDLLLKSETKSLQIRAFRIPKVKRYAEIPIQNSILDKSSQNSQHIPSVIPNSVNIIDSNNCSSEPSLRIADKNLVKNYDITPEVLTYSTNENSIDWEEKRNSSNISAFQTEISSNCADKQSNVAIKNSFSKRNKEYSQVKLNERSKNSSNRYGELSKSLTPSEWKEKHKTTRFTAEHSNLSESAYEINNKKGQKQHGEKSKESYKSIAFDCGICELCRTSYPTEESLASHLKTIHPTLLDRKYEFSSLYFQCTHCRHIDLKDFIVEHVNQHDEANFLPIYESLINIKNKFIKLAPSTSEGFLRLADYRNGDLRCIACPQTFKNEVELSYHMKFDHAGLMLFQCSFCSFETNARVCLTEHMEVHKNIFHTKNKCECGYVGRNCKLLEIHKNECLETNKYFDSLFSESVSTKSSSGLKRKNSSNSNSKSVSPDFKYRKSPKKPKTYSKFSYYDFDEIDSDEIFELCDSEFVTPPKSNETFKMLTPEKIKTEPANSESCKSNLDYNIFSTPNEAFDNQPIIQTENEFEIFPSVDDNLVSTKIHSNLESPEPILNFCASKDDILHNNSAPGTHLTNESNVTFKKNNINCGVKNSNSKPSMSENELTNFFNNRRSHNYAHKKSTNVVSTCGNNNFLSSASGYKYYDTNNYEKRDVYSSCAYTTQKRSTSFSNYSKNNKPDYNSDRSSTSKTCDESRRGENNVPKRKNMSIDWNNYRSNEPKICDNSKASNKIRKSEDHVNRKRTQSNLSGSYWKSGADL